MNETTSIYHYSDYKDYLKALVRVKEKGILSRLAQAAGCQRSFMSDVMRTHIELTMDHAFGIAAFLNLPQREKNYFLTMVQYARAASKAYKAELLATLKNEQQNFLRLTKRILAAEDAMPPQEEGWYYASWHIAAIHIATSIERLQTVARLCEHFGLAADFVASILKRLVAEGYVKAEGGKFLYNANKPNVHLSDQSIYSRMNHSNWRNLVVSRPQILPREIHYSSAFSVASKDMPVLREQILEFISKQRTLIAASGSDEVGCFCCDFFLI